MTLREIVLAQIHHRETNPVPYTFGFEPDVGARLDAHFGGETWRERLISYVMHCGAVHKTPSQPIDDSHYRDAFGAVWRTDILPSAVVEPALKAPTFDGYTFPSVEDFVNAEAKTAALQRVKDAPDAFTVLAPNVCLWQCWYLRGFEDTLMDCAAEEAFYEELLERMTQLTLDLIQGCADVPSDAIMMGDDWGNQRGIMIGPDRWRRLYKPRYARIFDAIHAQDKVAIMHCCGSTADIMGDIVDIGLDVLESVQPEAAGMNPYALKKAWGDKITFWGGLGSQQILPFGTPDEIRREIRHLRQDMSQGGGYILAPAKPLRPETPTENAVAAAEEFLAG